MRKLVRNKRALTALALVAGVALVLGGGLTASNMGFKLNRALTTAGPGSNSGQNTLGLPYNRQVGIDNASDLFSDIGAANVQLISRHLPATDTLQSYTSGSPDYALEQGKGYFAKMAVNLNYIIVGSHDPGAVIQLNTAGPGSNSGQNFFAPPYHSTAALASELFSELGAANVQLVSRFLPATDTLQSYTSGSPDYAIVPGQAYFLKMAANLAYSPSHY